LVLSVLGATAAIACWLYACYHLIMFAVRWMQLDPDHAVQRMLLGPISTPDAETPEPARVHRRNALRGMLGFAGCVAFLMLLWSIEKWIEG